MIICSKNYKTFSILFFFFPNALDLIWNKLGKRLFDREMASKLDALKKKLVLPLKKDPFPWLPKGTFKN